MLKDSIEELRGSKIEPIIGTSIFEKSVQCIKRLSNVFTLGIKSY